MPQGKQSGAFVPPNGGGSVWLAGIHITVKLTSEDTGGAYAMTEEITPPQGGAPPHAHDREDEALYVLEGEVEFLLGEDTIPAGAGSCAYAPRGALHAFKNVGTSPSRVLVVYSPGGSRSSFSRRASLPQRDPVSPRASRTWEGSWSSARSTVSKYRHLHLLNSDPFCEKTLETKIRFPRNRFLLGTWVNRGKKKGRGLRRVLALPLVPYGRAR